MMVNLYIWVLVAAGSGQPMIYDWLYAGEYKTPQVCQEAAKVLQPGKFVCLPNGKK